MQLLSRAGHLILTKKFRRPEKIGTFATLVIVLYIRPKYILNLKNIQIKKYFLVIHKKRNLDFKRICFKNKYEILHKHHYHMENISYNDII